MRSQNITNHRFSVLTYLIGKIVLDQVPRFFLPFITVGRNSFTYLTKQKFKSFRKLIGRSKSPPSVDISCIFTQALLALLGCLKMFCMSVHRTLFFLSCLEVPPVCFCGVVWCFGKGGLTYFIVTLNSCKVALGFDNR